MRFDEATAAAPLGHGRWSTPVHDGWDIGGNANGGYLLGLAARAMSAAAERPDPVTISAHYLRPGAPGPASVTASVIKTGRRFATVSATLADSEERPILQVLGAFSDLGDASLDGADIERVDATPPDLPPPDDCVRIEGTDTFPPPVMSRIDLRLHPDDALFTTGPSGHPLVRGWFRLLNDEPIDTIALLLAADAFPPTAFNAKLPVAWVPTVELTAHIRARPVPGWLRCEFTTRFVTGGFLEEDGVVWDDSGRLVAQSRQLALLPRG